MTINDGATAILVASQNGHHQVVRLLLAAGADQYTTMKDGTTPIFYRISTRIPSRSGTACTDSNARHDEGYSPLFLAAQNGYHQVVKVLLTAKANPDTRRNDGPTALYAASQNGHHQIVEILLDAGADKNVVMSDGSTPIIIASQMGYLQIVEMLLAASATVNIAIFCVLLWSLPGCRDSDCSWCRH